MSATVDILLATYNGSLYLEEQLDSLLQQDFKDIHIFIRDDGSKDNTPSIIQAWKNRFPEKITIIEDAQKNLGPTGNFNALMLASTAPYIAFSDQDDKWLPNKIGTQLQAIRQLEGGNPETPAFVFCDLAYCNKKLDILHPSLNKKDKLNPSLTQTNRLLMQNVPYGCATMINKSLLKTATPMPEKALLHDHWLALSASLLGKIGFIPQSLILHRVHDNNASRAASEHKKNVQNDISGKVSNKNFHQYLFKQTDQANALLEKYRAFLDKNQQKMLSDFIALKSTSGIRRKMLLLKNQFFKNTFAQTLKLLLRA